MNPIKKILGISGLLLAVMLFSIWQGQQPDGGDNIFLSSYNLENLLRRTALFGILSIGVAFVIITGGIDLSIGSIVAVVGVVAASFAHPDTYPIIVPIGAGLLTGILFRRDSVRAVALPGTRPRSDRRSNRRFRW